MQAAKDRIEQLEQELTADSSIQEASDGRDQIADVQMVLDKEEKIKQQLKELEHQNQMNLQIRSQVYHRKDQLTIPKVCSLEAQESDGDAVEKLIITEMRKLIEWDNQPEEAADKNDEMLKEVNARQLKQARKLI